MNDLKECPCGKTPTELLIFDAGQGGKYAYVGGNCCGYWGTEFRTGYYDLKSDECMKVAVTYWNDAERGSIPISKIEALIANCFDKHLPSALEDDLQKLIDEAKQ